MRERGGGIGRGEGRGSRKRERNEGRGRRERGSGRTGREVTRMKSSTAERRTARGSWGF